MKKLSYLIVLTLILGLVLTGCSLLSNVGQVPTIEQSGMSYLTKNGILYPDLVGLWRFNGDTTDSSGNDNHGTFFGVVEHYVDSPMGQALSFNGVGYVEIPDDVTLDITGEITIEAWLKTNVINNSWDVAVGKFQPSVGDTFQLGFNEASQKIYFELRTPTDTKRVRSNAVPTTGTWYHVAGVRESSGLMKLYIDGVLQDETNSISGDLRVNTSKLWIGGVQSGSYYFNGLIDEVRIWKTARTADQLIPYGFDGLLSPYVGPSRAFKLGRSIPLKWKYTNSADTVVDSSLADPRVRIVSVGNDAPPVTDDPIEVDDPGKSGLQYHLLTYTWQFNWQTKDLTPGTYDIYITSVQTNQVDGPFQILLQ